MKPKMLIIHNGLTLTYDPNSGEIRDKEGHLITVPGKDKNESEVICHLNMLISRND